MLRLLLLLLFCTAAQVFAQQTPAVGIVYAPAGTYEAVASDFRQLQAAGVRVVRMPPVQDDRLLTLADTLGLTLGERYPLRLFFAERERSVSLSVAMPYLLELARRGSLFLTKLAEMLQTLLGYATGAGIDNRWLVLDGDESFFTITKRLHNMLHGEGGDGGDAADLVGVPLGPPEQVPLVHRLFEQLFHHLAAALQRLGGFEHRRHVGLHIARAAIGDPQFGQCGVPARANRRRR